MDQLLQVLQVAGGVPAGAVSTLLVVLWLLAVGKLRAESELETLKEQMDKRLAEMQAQLDAATADRDYYRDKYDDGDALRRDRDYYRDKLSESTNILSTLLSTVEVDEEVER